MSEFRLPYGHTMDEYVRMHNKEFHFRDMHVYVNQLFKTHAEADNRYTCRWNDERTIQEHHHVHIFIWHEGDDTDNLIAMGTFINVCNQVTEHPVYIHVPKKHRELVDRIRRLLNSFYFDKRKLRYEIICEKNTHVTNFVYEQWSPYVKRRPRTLLSVCWDARKYARPVFYDVDSETITEIFKEDAIDGKA